MPLLAMLNKTKLVSIGYFLVGATLIWWVRTALLLGQAHGLQLDQIRIASLHIFLLLTLIYMMYDQMHNPV